MGGAEARDLVDPFYLRNSRSPCARDEDVFFLAITTDEDREQVAPFLKRYKFNLPVAYADYLNDHFAVSSIPTTIILDRYGEVSFRQAGFNPREDFIESLSEKIEDAKKR